MYFFFKAHLIQVIGYSIISAFLGICAISLIYLFSIVTLINGMALDIPLIYNYQQAYYYQDIQQIWQYDSTCAQHDEDLIYSPKFGRCNFSNPEFKTTLNFNGEGRAVPARSNANLHKKGIVILGDSHAMGWGVNDDDTFANVLQKTTDKPVFNLGVSSYGTERELKRFSLSGLSNKVDTVIIQYCNNDHGENLTNPMDIYTKERVASFRDVLYTSAEQKNAISKREIVKKHIYRALHVLQIWLVNLVKHQPEEKNLDFQINNKVMIEVLSRYKKILSNKKIYILYVNGHGERYMNFHSSEGQIINNLIYIDPLLEKSDFYLLDDHLTPMGQKKLGERLSKAVITQN